MTPANPAITTANANALVMLFDLAAFAIGEDVTSRTAGAPSGYSGLVSRKHHSTYRDILLAHASKVIATAGAETPGAWTHTADDATTDHVLYTVAVRSA